MSRLLMVLNDAATFLAREGLARRAREAGWDVHLAAPQSDALGAITDWPTHPVRMDRRNLMPWRELPCLRDVRRVVHDVQPDLVHAFALKPIVHAGLAARRTGTPLVASVTGLGSLFLDRRYRTTPARAALVLALRRACTWPGAVTVFQNEDDRDRLLQARVARPAASRIIPGSGVDMERFLPGRAASPPAFVLVGRMLRDKGVVEFQEAARLARAGGLHARFLLVGGVDPGNPSTLDEATLQTWHQEGHVEWLGHVKDVLPILQRAYAACLPSYGEGLPRTLLEGGACGLPLIATDVPGCRDVCIEGETGLLVPPRSAAALAHAVERLVRDPRLAKRLGSGARRLVETRFERRRIEEAYLALYEDAIALAAKSTGLTAT